MGAPWEKYQTSEGPWKKFQSSPRADPQPLSNQIPGNEKALDGNRNVGKPDNSTLWDKAKGVADAALTMGTGSLGMMAGLVQAPIERLTGQTKDAEKRIFDIADHYTWTPRTEKGREYLDKVEQVSDDLKLQGLVGMPLNEMAHLSSTVSAAKPFVKPAVSSAVARVTESPEAYALKQGAKTLADKVPSMNMRLTPEMQELNAKARNFGITLQPHHFSDNKFVKILGETFDNVPLSGARDSKNQIAFEKALIKQIGGDETETKLTPKVFDRAMRKSGTTIDAITRKYDIKPSEELSGSLAGIVKEANQIETPENAKVIAGWVEKINGKMQDGPMKGAAFRKLNTDLSRKIRETQNGDLRNALSDIQDTLLAEFNKGIADPKDKELLMQARTQYAKAKTLAPIVGDPKGVSPAKLLGAVRNTKANKERYARGRAGDLGDLADIGQLLKDPNSSNTAERGLVYGGLGSGVAGVLNPALAAPAIGIYGGANLYNRFSPYLIRPKQ